MSAKGFRFHLLDVFGTEKYTGNRLAVVELKAPLETGVMQRIAAEFDFPETTFVAPRPRKGGEFDVRIFTPRNEIPFAGHPTLGTAHVIRERLAEGRPSSVVLNLKIGKIRVDADARGSLLWMKQKPPAFGRKHEPARVARLLGLKAGAIDAAFPVQEVTTGLPVLLVPLRSLEPVRAARVEDKAYRAYFKAGDELPLFIFSRETYDRAHAVNCRMFAPSFGIPEDPATGSANGCLAGYILKHGYLEGNPVDLIVEQGYEMGRNSLLHLRAKAAAGKLDVRVGGRVFEIGTGRFD